MKDLNKIHKKLFVSSSFFTAVLLTVVLLFTGCEKNQNDEVSRAFSSISEMVNFAEEIGIKHNEGLDKIYLNLLSYESINENNVYIIKQSIKTNTINFTKSEYRNYSDNISLYNNIINEIVNDVYKGTAIN